MNIKTARRVGGGLAIKTLLGPVILFEVIMLIMETKGDFGNGILFFLAIQLNPFVIAALTLLFSMTYLCGRSAGRTIFLSSRHFAVVGLTYSIIVSVVFAAYLAGVFLYRKVPQDGWRTFPLLLVVIAVVLAATWIWTGWRIARALHTA